MRFSAGLFGLVWHQFGTNQIATADLAVASRISLRASVWKTDLFYQRGVPWIGAHRVVGYNASAVIAEVELERQT